MKQRERLIEGEAGDREAEWRWRGEKWDSLHSRGCSGRFYDKMLMWECKSMIVQGSFKNCDARKPGNERSQAVTFCEGKMTRAETHKLEDWGASQSTDGGWAEKGNRNNLAWRDHCRTLLTGWRPIKQFEERKISRMWVVYSWHKPRINKTKHKECC